MKKTQFKKLVTGAFIESLSLYPSYGLQKRFILVQALWNCGISLFNPNLSISLHSEGSMYTIHLINQPVLDTSLYASSSDSLKISKMSPMETSLELSSPCRRRWRMSTSLDNTDSNDFIWYRAHMLLRVLR